MALAANSAVLFLWGLALAQLQGVSTVFALAAGMITCALGVVLVVLGVLVH